MSKAHLTPTAVLDKNGKQTTVHKKVDSGAKTGQRAMPAPSLGAVPPKKKALKPPLPKQLKVEALHPYQSKINPDPELVKLLDYDDSGMLFYEASQMQTLDVLSVVGIDDGIALLSKSFTNSESVIALLNTYDMQHLIVDRREMMNEAASQRVEPIYLMKMHEHYPIDNYDAETYLFASKLAQSVSVPTFQDDSGKRHTFHDSILNGEMSVDDVRDLGSTYLIAKQSYVKSIHGALKAIHAGTTDCDLDTLKHVIEHSLFPETAAKTLGPMLEDHGKDFILSMDHFEEACATDLTFENRTVEARQSLMRYQQEASDGEKYFRSIDVGTLSAAGVPPSFARSVIGRGMLAEQIIDAHNAGIQTAVVDGWL